MNEWTAETADWYAEKYGEYATNRLGFAALEVAPDAMVVDTGCGTGCALRQLAPRVPQGHPGGYRPGPRMIEIARERALEHSDGRRIQFLVGPARKLPIADDTPASR